MHIEKLNVLLISVRKDPITREEEHNEFAKLSGIKKEQIQLLNTFDTPDFAANLIDGYDVLFMGGSSDASVTKPEESPFLISMYELIRRAREIKIPTFAACFGLQVASEALGGKVIHDPDNQENGSIQIYTNEEGKKDAIFNDFPDGEWVIASHRDRATVAPENSTVLAYTEKCPIQAFKLNDAPFYGMQFHPEIDRNDFIARWTRYKEKLHLSEDDFQKGITETRETPFSNALLGKFIERIVLAE